jgi:hypothetical protein
MTENQHMHAEKSNLHPWWRSMVAAAVAYAAIGIVSAAVSQSADPSHVRPWRLAAWVGSAAVYALHIRNEHRRVGSSAGSNAWHVAAAVALGAFGLALAANIHSLSVATSSRHALQLVLVAWPAITAVPAFLVALVVCVALDRFWPRG